MPRPKLKEGEKCNYRVSMEEYMRREARKKVKAKNKNLQKQKTKVANLAQGVKKANEALNVLENGGTLSEDS